MLKNSKLESDPLYYYLVDHSGFHGPTSTLLADILPQILMALPKELSFELPKLSEKEAEYFDRLFTAENVDDVSAVTLEEKKNTKACQPNECIYILLAPLIDIIVSVVSDGRASLSSRDSVTMSRSNEFPESEHTYRNVVPFLDATIGSDDNYRIK
ncbi:hypothetical protein BC938DRAFT_471494 [Jimgerdemannia flammicorona]|uniref:Uncharacterized protein n=1 Tax=Jimgerdemannia flammicorona TaxID=994334 RepID=A0A433Q7V9_9FUNG|nr:hypothetical protein BC938DRAFT_471494 [Jimgerdemannia flammicorona]